MMHSSLPGLNSLLHIPSHMSFHFPAVDPRSSSIDEFVTIGSALLIFSYSLFLNFFSGSVVYLTHGFPISSLTPFSSLSKVAFEHPSFNRLDES